MNSIRLNIWFPFCLTLATGLACSVGYATSVAGPSPAPTSAPATLSQTGENREAPVTSTITLPVVNNNPDSVPDVPLIQPADLVYLGAFGLPGGDEPPRTFAYGGNAMTFNPDGDPDNTDAFPGSLFITGHDRQAWGGLPDGDQVAEIAIPVPAMASDPATLPQASFVQDFADVFAGHFTDMEEIPKLAMAYLNVDATGPLIHVAWGQHIQPPDVASHAWFSPALKNPGLTGEWFIGNENMYSVNGYMFTIPPEWAHAYVGDQPLATGRMRDGGQGGMGPALFAYRPWQADGSPPPDGTHLGDVTPLLQYQSADVNDRFEHTMAGYQHPDEWEGGAWLTTPGGKTAVIFAGTKATGSRQWYGYVNPDGAELPCVDAEVTDFTTCRLADGTACPHEDFEGCCNEGENTCASLRGWWSTRFDAQIIFFDPAQLARVTMGSIETWDPQPYAVLDIDEHLFLNPGHTDEMMLGTGDQRRYRIGDAAFDPNGGYLYVLELYADGAKPLVHVWHVAQ